MDPDREDRSMIDDSARIARLMNVCDAIINELQRQGVADVMAMRGFKVTAMAEAVIKATDEDVIPFPFRGPSH
jgi:hypothetical protein